VIGQRATAEKSNEKTAIPELLSTLALEGCTVTSDNYRAELIGLA
jgi:predicted transposase YbfD/YdcC